MHTFILVPTGTTGALGRCRGTASRPRALCMGAYAAPRRRPPARCACEFAFLDRRDRHPRSRAFIVRASRCEILHTFILEPVSAPLASIVSIRAHPSSPSSSRRRSPSTLSDRTGRRLRRPPARRVLRTRVRVPRYWRVLQDPVRRRRPAAGPRPAGLPWLRCPGSRPARPATGPRPAELPWLRSPGSRPVPAGPGVPGTRPRIHPRPAPALGFTALQLLQSGPSCGSTRRSPALQRHSRGATRPKGGPTPGAI